MAGMALNVAVMVLALLPFVSGFEGELASAQPTQSVDFAGLKAVTKDAMIRERRKELRKLKKEILDIRNGQFRPNQPGEENKGQPKGGNKKSALVAERREVMNHLRREIKQIKKGTFSEQPQDKMLRTGSVPVSQTNPWTGKTDRKQPPAPVPRSQNGDALTAWRLDVIKELRKIRRSLHRLPGKPTGLKSFKRSMRKADKLLKRLVKKDRNAGCATSHHAKRRKHGKGKKNRRIMKKVLKLIRENVQGNDTTVGQTEADMDPKSDEFNPRRSDVDAGSNGFACTIHKDCLPGHCCHRNASSTTGTCTGYFEAVDSECAHSCQCSHDLQCYRSHKNKHHYKGKPPLMARAKGETADDANRDRGKCKVANQHDIKHGEYLNAKQSFFVDVDKQSFFLDVDE